MRRQPDGYYAAQAHQGSRIPRLVVQNPKSPVCSPETSHTSIAVPSPVCAAEKVAPNRTVPSPVRPAKNVAPNRTVPSPLRPAETVAPNHTVQSPLRPAEKVATIRTVPSPVRPTKNVAPNRTVPSPLRAAEKVAPKHREASKSLRETIARAKAAHKCEHSVETPSIQSRVAAARLSGKLNIAALGLTRLPRELLLMYQLDQLHGVSWAECVDLVHLNAADNELQVLDDEFFPHGEEECNLSALEALDVHGNHLSRLPRAIALLSRLTHLNVARNALSSCCTSDLGKLEVLREINLSENRILGDLDLSLWQSKHLEAVDMSGNQIETIILPELHTLKSLKLTRNRLTAIPLCGENLRILNVSANRISNVNLPVGPHLTQLDLSDNQITALEPSLQLPRLQTLSLHNNRLTVLPDLSECRELAVLGASGNLLGAFPRGITVLGMLKNVDLSQNNIREIPLELGMMKSLAVLNVGDNPLRERRLLRLSTADLKEEFLGRLEPLTKAPIAAETEGKMDLASRGLTSVKIPEDVVTLSLRNNLLRNLPSHANLVRLDISHNKLGNSLSGTFPQMRCLNLCANEISSLEQMTVEAPFLEELDISRNRLSELVPMRFPRLTTLLAAGNQLTTLQAESVAGLTVLDVTGNAISVLDPQIGFSGLKTLLVGANTFRVPRREVVEKGTEAILAWLRDRLAS